MVAIPLISGWVHTYPKLSGLSAFLGLVMALSTNPKVVFLVSTLLNLFFPETPASPAGVTGPEPQKKDGGFISPTSMFMVMFVLLSVMFVLLIATKAHAQSGDQKYGGCLAPTTIGQVCVGPRAGALITRYDLSGPLSGKFTGGFQPGAGYGIILQSTDWTQDWKRVEFDVFGSFTLGGSVTTVPNSFSLTGLFTVFNYISVGAGSQWIEQPSGPAKASFFITGGVTLNIGGNTPAQAKAHRDAVLKAAAQPAGGE